MAHNIRNYKGLLLFILVVTMILPTVSVIPQASAEPLDASPHEIVIEGEDVTMHNFTDIVENGAYSGGKLLRLETQAEAPEGGYTAAFTFDVAEAGPYEMLVTSTPPPKKYGLLLMRSK